LSLYLPNQRLGEHIADTVLRIPDAEPLARCFAAATLVQAGRSAEAQVVINKALADAPADARVVRRAAKFQARIGNMAQSVELFGKALNLDPDDMETQRSYGWALFNFRQPAEAAAHFLAAEGIVGPMNDDLIAGLCLSAAAARNQTEARQAFQRLVALDPQWKAADYLSSLRGWTQSELNMLEGVRAALFPSK
jgi:Tfp pilus assembly protein PilF